MKTSKSKILVLMAIFKNSTFGSMRKSIGDDVAYRSGGQNIVRKKPAYVRDAQTIPQQGQRAAFALLVSLFRNISAIVTTAFPERLQKRSAYNDFMAKNLKQAVTIIGAEAEINYPDLAVSSGSLPVSTSSDFTDNLDGSAAIQLKDQTVLPGVLANDKQIIVCINESRPSDYSINSFPADSTNEVDVTTPRAENGDIVHVYIFTQAENKAKASDSLYLGRYEVV